MYTRHGSGVYVAGAASTDLAVLGCLGRCHGWSTNDRRGRAECSTLGGRTPCTSCEIVAGLDKPPPGRIRLLANTQEVDDYWYLQLRDELAVLPALELERRTVGPVPSLGSSSSMSPSCSLGSVQKITPRCPPAVGWLSSFCMLPVPIPPESARYRRFKSGSLRPGHLQPVSPISSVLRISGNAPPRLPSSPRGASNSLVEQGRDVFSARFPSILRHDSATLCDVPGRPRP